VYNSYGNDTEIMFLHYLPTINLMVFVKTPFKASARDTAAK